VQISVKTRHGPRSHASATFERVVRHNYPINQILSLAVVQAVYLSSITSLVFQGARNTIASPCEYIYVKSLRSVRALQLPIRMGFVNIYHIHKDVRSRLDIQIPSRTEVLSVDRFAALFGCFITQEGRSVY
jgi:hypothetical protein